MKKTLLLSTLLLLLSVGYSCQDAKSEPLGPNEPEVPAVQSMSAEEAATLSQDLYVLLSDDYVATNLEQNWKFGRLKSGDYTMKFWQKIYGDKPAAGYPMYISMHGGGGTTSAVNDGQWDNQKILYGNVNGLYWVPRAPTDTWNMWHQGYMDDFLLQAVTYAVRKLEVDPNRIYLMGYSAGGDGTYNLAPRLADRFAAAAMMAGHPGDARAENLRNLPFAIYMGGLDAAYDRNTLAAEWGEKLAALQAADPEGYVHRVRIYPDKPHWMDGEDKESIDWMAGFVRGAAPNRIVWIQDDVLATRKYNLEVKEPSNGDVLTINIVDNVVTIEESTYGAATIWLNDNIVDLDREVTVRYDQEILYKGYPQRSSENIKYSIEGRYDPAYIFSAKIDVTIPQK